MRDPQSCACGRALSLAAIRCPECAIEHVASARWWIEMALAWRWIGTWYTWYHFNLRGIRSISQQAWDRLSSEVTA